MSSIVLLVLMWWAAGLAVVRATFRRLLLGPTAPSWTWRTEWFVATARAAIAEAAEHQDDMVVNLFGRLVRTPIPPSLRGKVKVHRTKIAGIPVDRYVRLTEPSDDATILYFHGGGYVFGNPGTHREHIARLVSSTRSAAIAPQYRLAPKHPYPAAVDDALAAYEAILDGGVNPQKLIVSGDSAGGGLALATVLRARDRGLPMPAGIMLFSPYVDLTHSGYTIPINATTDYLPLAELSKPNDFYAPGRDLTMPEISPLFADFTGFPPMLIFAGGVEMLLDDAVRLDARARAAGVDSTLIVEDDMIHVWPLILSWEPATPRTLTTCATWFSRTLNP